MAFLTGFLADAGRTIVPARGDRHGPLAPLMVTLTFVTGVVDAVSFLKLGHVFVANMTGNTVFLGFGLAGSGDVSVPSSLVAIGAFVVGAALAGYAIRRIGGDRALLLCVGTVVEAAFLCAGVVVVYAAGIDHDAGHYILIVLLAVGMAVQTAVARALAVPDLRTTVLTLTYTGLAADTATGAGLGARPGRRVVAVLTMFVGALVGGLLTLHVSVGAALILALAVVALVAVVTAVLARARPGWAAAP